MNTRDLASAKPAIPLRQARVLHPEKMSRVMMHSARVLYAQRRYGYLSVGEVQYRFHPVWPLPTVTSPLVLHLTIGRRSAWMALEGHIAEQLLDAHHPHIFSEDLPAALRAVAIERMAAPILRYFEENLGQRISVRRVSHQLPSQALRMANLLVGLHIDVAKGGQGKLVLCWPDSLLSELTRALPNTGVQAWSAPESMEFSARLVLGSTVLSLEAWQSLRVGDAVMLERHAGRRERLGVAVGSLAYTATLRDGALTIEHEGYDMGDKDAANADALSDALPVQLHFELGRVNVTLQQLQQMLPGYTIPLGRDLSAPVDLIANGKKVGRGKLMDVDGEVAVRVVQLGQ